MGISLRRAKLSLVLITSSFILAACGGDDGPGATDPTAGTPPVTGSPSPGTPPSSGGSVQDPPGSGTDGSPSPGSGDPPAVKNSVPTIKGTPQPIVLQDTPHAFEPEASDGDGDILHFSISNPPPWAKFEPMSGRLHGTPTAADVGTYANIKITVTD